MDLYINPVQGYMTIPWRLFVGRLKYNELMLFVTFQCWNRLFRRIVLDTETKSLQHMITRGVEACQSTALNTPSDQVTIWLCHRDTFLLPFQLGRPPNYLDKRVLFLKNTLLCVFVRRRTCTCLLITGEWLTSKSVYQCLINHSSTCLWRIQDDCVFVI